MKNRSRNSWTQPLALSSAIAAALLGALTIYSPVLARADIYQWEWVNPNDHNAGKQPSTVLAIGGAGANAVPGANLDNKNLTMAYLIGCDLTDASLYHTDLTNADLSRSNLTNGRLYGTIFTGANFADANLHNADLRNAVSNGFTAAQLYLTANYKNFDLSEIDFGANQLNGWNFVGQQLSYTSFWECGLSGANFAGADIRYATFTGSGLTADQLYSTASYLDHDLSGVQLLNKNLIGWNFAGQKLSYGSLGGATVTGADFNGAIIDHTPMYGLTGFTAEQLYSTASYQDHNLTRISLKDNKMASWNFADQNLSGAFLFQATLNNSNFSHANLENANLSLANMTGANFDSALLVGATMNQTNFTGANLGHVNLFGASLNGATLAGASLDGAEVRGVNFSAVAISKAQLYSTASYQSHDLTGIQIIGGNVSNWDFAGQNLTKAVFTDAKLTGTDFSGAVIQGASLGRINAQQTLTASQIYSTASYQNRNLAGVALNRENLSGWNFAGQNLTNASFTQATLTGTVFTAADTRGAINLTDSMLTPADTTNLIRPNGHVNGLIVTGGQAVEVRDYNGDSSRSLAPISITVDEQMQFTVGGKLRFTFEENPWDSTIAFASGILVNLNGGILELAFADGAKLATQIGRTLHLFNWTGVAPIGSFNVVSNYEWDLTQLYTTGEVTLLSVGFIPGDFDGDGDVDGADIVSWQANFPKASGAILAQGDADGDGDVDGADFIVWQTNFPFSPGSGALTVRESTGFCLAAAGLVLVAWTVRTSKPS